MNEKYDAYIETINGLEVVEAQVIKDSKVKRMLLFIIGVCESSYYLLEKC